MTRKLQVFISSTFTDLKEERQAAVEAVLKAGHIPAGMELFRSEDQSQKDTIMKWIDESDVYLLILGGRYGSIEQTSGKSYTHWEYEYAEEAGKKRFAVVIGEKALDEKVKTHGQEVIETKNNEKYEDFKKLVLSKTSQFFEDNKDIQLTIMQSLSEYSKDESLQGWVSGNSNTNLIDLTNHIIDLTKQLKDTEDKYQKIKKTLQDTEQKKPNKKNALSLINDFSKMSEKTNNIIELLTRKQVSHYSASPWFYYKDANNDDQSISYYHPADLNYEFELYINKENKNFIQCFILAKITEDKFDSVLAHIRILIRKYKKTYGIFFQFVIAICSSKTEYVERADVFFKNALSSEQMKDRYFINTGIQSLPIDKPSLMNLEIWDDRRIQELESELSLR